MFKLKRGLTLSHAEIHSYAESMNAAQFPYFCAATGELGESLSYVIRTTSRFFLKCGILHSWRMTRNW